MDKIIPLKSLTGLLELPESGLLRLDFLITEEADGLYIRCLDFGIMSRGDTLSECQENIIEAMMIYLEDLPDGQSLFHPAPPQYWQMFYELRCHQERTITKQLSRQAKQAMVNLPVVFQYA